MRIVANGIGIEYEVLGSGPPLVMVHGNGEDHHTFDVCADVLKDYFTVYLPDSRGHGMSDQVAEYHYSDMADDVVCFIEALGLEKPLLVGYSDGGIIGLLVASGHPGLLSGLVSCGANTDPSMLTGFFMFRCRHSRKLRSDPKIRMMLEEPRITEEMLSRIDVPALVIAGSRDCIKPEDTEFIASSVKGAEKMILRGEDHGSYIEGRDLLADIILDWRGLR